LARICVVGTGYVGLVTGACLADLGNEVVGVDIDEAKVAKLRQGIVPIYEPGLEEIITRNAHAGRLRFTTSYAEGVGGADFIFIAVNTPSGVSGEADMSQVRAAARSIGEHLTGPAIVINKSTMPIGAGDQVASILARYAPPGIEVGVVSNPEFLREGSAIADFQKPDRIVLGATDPAVAAKVAALYQPLGCPVLITDLRTAEMVKYASNAFLATKISFINEMAAICEQLGADVTQVAAGMGLDKRIGRAFLDAGLGFGGSCFPKDVRALAHMASMYGCHPQLLRAVMEINQDTRRGAVSRLRRVLGSLEERTIAVLGLAFKPNTDDLREAAAVEIIHLLLGEGAHVRAYDPAAMERARELLPEVTFCSDAYDAAAGAHGLVLVTEWNEFRHLDLVRLRDAMAYPFIVDGRNIWDPERMVALGFVYSGIGRGQVVHGLPTPLGNGLPGNGVQVLRSSAPADTEAVQPSPG